MKAIPLVTCIFILVLSGLLSAQDSSEEFLSRENRMIKNTPLESLPEGIWVNKPVGKLLLNFDYFGSEFKYEPDVSHQCYGLFSQNTEFKNSYEIYKNGDRNLKLVTCTYSVVFDSTDDWKPYKIRINNDESPGALFFLVEGIMLKPNDKVKTWFIGKDSFIKRTPDRKYEFITHTYQTEYGNLLVEPDTTMIVNYEQKISDEITIRESIAPFYVSFGEKRSLIKRDIYYGNEGDPRIIWVGDLDNDNIPDMLIDISTHYAGGHYMLLLSSIAKDGELYGLAGRLMTASC